MYDWMNGASSAPTRGVVATARLAVLERFHDRARLRASANRPARMARATIASTTQMSDELPDFVAVGAKVATGMLAGGAGTDATAGFAAGLGFDFARCGR